MQRVINYEVYKVSLNNETIHIFKKKTHMATGIVTFSNNIPTLTAVKVDILLENMY